jgi:muramidase (phage lysozyme)
MSEKNPLENPNVQKFLDFLGKAEGADYNVIVGGKKFNDFSKHPRIVGLRTKEGPSTAAGKYQITKTTYDDFAPKLGITDFSPRSQDRIAVAIFQKEKALSDIERGDFNAAISKLGRRFASLPSSPYSQPKRSQDFVDMQLGVVGLASAEPSKMQRTAASAKKPQFDVAAGPKKAPAKGKLALSDLPESYRSALALNFLVDSDPEDELMAKATQLLQASMPEQGGGPAGGKVLQQYAAQMPEVSPYQFLQPSPPDPGPTKMATGGLAIGGLAMFKEGGEVLGKEPEDKAKEEAMEMLLNLQQQVGPVSGQFVPSAQGLDIRARTDVLGLRPFVDIDPREQRISQYGASYGGATPQGQYDVTVSRRTPMQTPMGPMEMPVVAQGMYRAPIGKAGELSVQGFYVPEQGQMSRPAYGANLMYRQRFANGGEVTGDDLFQQMITGRVVEPVYEAPPPKVNYSQAVPGSEVPVIDRLTGRVMRDEPQPEFRGTVLQEIVGAGEAAAAVGTGITSLVPGAGRIIKGLLTPGETAEQTQKAASQTMQDFTYLPKGKAGQRNIMDLQDVIPKELTGAMPQVQLMRPLLAPGAAGILRQRAKDAMDVRGGPGGAPPMSGMGLQPAMAAVGQGPVDRTAADRPLVRPAEGVAVPSITQSTRINRDLFGEATEELDKLPTSPEVEQVLSAHIGGVGNFGDPDAKYYLSAVPGGPEYTQQSQAIAKKYFGDKFMGYRLMPREEFEALKVGDVGDLLSFSVSKDAANAFRRFAPNQKREDLILAEVPLTPNHVLGFGSRGEQEVIVDTSVGWSLDDFKRSSAPKQKEQIDRSSILPSEKTPLVSELERRVADLPGPVQKEQFINTIKNNSRDYEIRRVEEALAEFGPKDKLTPNQIMSALKRTSPSRYNLQVIPAELGKSGFYQTSDNPYPARKIGSVNLLLEPQEAQRQVTKLYKNIQEFRFSEPTLKIFGQSPTFIDDYVRKVKDLADQVEEFDAQLSTTVKIDAENVLREARPILDLQQARNYVKNPQLDPKNKWLVNWNEKTVPQEIKNLLQSRGVNTLTPELTEMAARELATTNYLKELNKQINSKNEYGSFARRIMTSPEKDELNYLTSSPDSIFDKTLGGVTPKGLRSNLSKYEDMLAGIKGYYQEIDNLQTGKLLPGDSPEKNKYMKEMQQQFSAELDYVLTMFDPILAKTRMEVIHDVRNLSQQMLDSKKLKKGRIFSPENHTSINGENPISFARYVEVEPFDIVNPPANLSLEPGKGLLFTELQSDRRAELSAQEKGKPGPHMNKGIEEPYPNFTKDPDTLSELMMKSAVAGAQQLNKKFVLFPGKDSDKKELYGEWIKRDPNGKVYNRNSPEWKQAQIDKDMDIYYPSIMQRVAVKVAKDLGKGYEAREFKTINGKGEEITRVGIVFPDDTSELTKKGIRFAKGGLVGNPLYDRL